MIFELSKKSRFKKDAKMMMMIMIIAILISYHLLNVAHSNIIN